MIGKYYARAIITNRNLLFWGVLFMLFWLIMGAFAFGFKPETKIFNLEYTSTWFALIALYSISTIGTTVAFSLYYGNSAIGYAFKYTHLTRWNLTLSIILAVSLGGILLGSFMLSLSVIFFSLKAGYIILPALPYYSIIVEIAGGIIMFLISGCLLLLVNNHFSLKNISFISFVPTILSYIFGFNMLSSGIPPLLAISNPFSELIGLFYYSYSGTYPSSVLSTGSGPHLNPIYLGVGLILWIVILFILFAWMISGIRPVSSEEARQI